MGGDLVAISLLGRNATPFDQKLNATPLFIEIKERKRNATLFSYFSYKIGIALIRYTTSYQPQ
jgi:hypothetical protein